VELVVNVTLVAMEPPLILTVAPEIAAPLEFFTVPASFPPVASLKFSVVVAPPLTVAV
jgi:hypothetical protein